MAFLRRKKAQQSSDVKIISFAGSATTMSVEEHASQFVNCPVEREKQIAALSKIDDISVIHGQLIRLLSKDMYMKYEASALKYVKMYSEDDPRFPDKKEVIRQGYMSILAELIPNMFGEVRDIVCPECRQVVDVNSTECQYCGRVVAGVNLHAEAAYDDEASMSVHMDDKHHAFIKRLNSFCRRDVASANVTEEILTCIRNHIESEDPSYRHAEIMKRPLVNHERPGTSVNMLIDAIGKMKNPKLYCHMELICQQLWGWEFPDVDEELFRFIEEIYCQIRAAINSFPPEETILIHQNNMLYMVLSLAFKIRNVKYVVKRDNFKVPRDPIKQMECDRFFAKVVERAGIKMCELH